MGGRAELENDRAPWRNADLAVDRAASFLRTRPPVGEEGEEVGWDYVAVAVEVGGAMANRADPTVTTPSSNAAHPPPRRPALAAPAALLRYHAVARLALT